MAQQISLFALPTRKHTAKIFFFSFFSHLLVDCPWESQDSFFSFLFGFFLSFLKCFGEVNLHSKVLEAESMIRAWIHAGALTVCLACDCRVQSWAIPDLPELLTAPVMPWPDPPTHPSHS